ncbi:MAG: cytochrome c [Kofleriaceae bacterium]|nr:cytochrome c [Kofleriaceae bacterium]
MAGKILWYFVAWLALHSLALHGCNRPAAGGSQDGATVYAAVCATCHGDKGKPSASMTAQLGVRDLTEPAFRTRVTVALVAAQIRQGSANKLMPAFAGSLTDAQIAAVAAWVVDGLPAAP